MTLPLGRPDVRAARAHLAPYAQRTLDEAGRFAWRIHADEVAVEHLFCTLLADEESAASQAVLHAFADPETIASELMALCPGIMVVGSDRCLPFSARSVLALRAARAAAALGLAARVEPGHVLAAALDELPPDADAALRAAGARRPPAPPEAPAGEPAVPAEGPLFKHFSNASKRGLSTAGHLASRLTREAVSPAHLLLGALEVEPDLGAAIGIGAARARLCLSGLDRDETRPPEREVPPAADLLAFLASAEPGADTLSLLSLLLARGEPEVIQLFTRQKVTSEVLARARGHLQDPETAAPRGL